MKTAIRPIRLLIALIVCATLATGARAQDEAVKDGAIIDLSSARHAMKSCADTIDAMPRLLCYDDLALRMDLLLAKDEMQREKTLAKYGFWTITTQKDAMGIQATTLRLPTSTPYKSGNGLDRVPDFVIKCAEKKTEAYVDWKGILAVVKTGVPDAKAIYVDYRVDDLRQNAYWDLSVDKMAAFAPDSIAFVRDMKGKKDFVLELTPPEGGKKTLVFALDGLDPSLDILVKNCYQQ